MQIKCLSILIFKFIFIIIVVYFLYYSDIKSRLDENILMTGQFCKKSDFN